MSARLLWIIITPCLVRLCAPGHHIWHIHVYFDRCQARRTMSTTHRASSSPDGLDTSFLFYFLASWALALGHPRSSQEGHNAPLTFGFCASPNPGAPGFSFSVVVLEGGVSGTLFTVNCGPFLVSSVALPLPLGMNSSLSPSESESESKGSSSFADLFVCELDGSESQALGRRWASHTTCKLPPTRPLSCLPTAGSA